MIYCHSDKSYPCQVEIGLRLVETHSLVFLSDIIMQVVENEYSLNRAAQLKSHYLAWEVFSTPYRHRQASIDLVQPFFLVFPDPFFAFRRQNLLLILTIGKNALLS